MGLVTSVIKYFTGSGEDETVVDPATGLSVRDTKLITASWEVLGHRKTQKKYGAALFIQLFEKFPSTKLFFPFAIDKSSEQLRTAPQMRAHAATLMHQLGAYVDNLEDPECLVGVVEKLARNHLKRNIGYKEFEELRSMFGEFLDAELGSQSSDELKQAWDRLLLAQSNIIKRIAEEEFQE